MASICAERAWLAKAALLVFPFAAVLHHAVFYYPTCMMNPFSTMFSTDLQTLLRWLTRDPSLPWALVLAGLVYYLGMDRPAIRGAVVPFLICFLPLTVWVWDIPFTNRIICRLFHDGRGVLWDTIIMGRHFYIVGAVSFAAVMSVKAVRWKQFA